MYVHVERETSADRINAILNDPAVRPWVADDSEGVIDVAPQVSNERNILLTGDHGGCFFFWLQPGVYEVHTQVLPRARGEWARGMMEACAHWMFTRSDCYEIITRVPHGHTAARVATIGMGLRYEFTRPKECRFRGKIVDADIYSYRVQDWIGRAAGLTELGAWFHRRLHEEAARLGIATTAHEDDPNHNIYVGAAYEMALGGWPAKGVMFYNRWAAASRHDLIRLLSTSPVTIRFDIGILRLIDGDIEVIREQ